jgi:putrescine:ornithine antiporter
MAMAITTCTIVFCAAPMLPGQSVQRQSGTLERIRERGHITFGYRTDSRPFSYRDESGLPAGYAVGLCRQIAAALKTEPGMAEKTDVWVQVSTDTRFAALQKGQIDLLCGAETVTLARRSTMSFSIPTFPGGIGVLVRADAPAALREVLSGRGRAFHPTWRASATQVLQSRTFSGVENTTSQEWLTDRLRDLQVSAKVVVVGSHDAGVRTVLDRRSDAIFGERAALLDAANRLGSQRDLIVIDRLFTYEPLALALRHGDEDFRLFVDRALSRFYGSPEMHRLYTKWFSEPDANTLTFFRWNTLPE